MSKLKFYLETMVYDKDILLVYSGKLLIKLLSSGCLLKKQKHIVSTSIRRHAAMVKGSVPKKSGYFQAAATADCHIQFSYVYSQ